MECFILKFGEYKPEYALANILMRKDDGIKIELITKANYGRGSQHLDHWCINSCSVKYDDFLLLLEEDLESQIYKEAVDIATTNAFNAMSIIDFVNYYRKAESIE